MLDSGVDKQAQPLRRTENRHLKIVGLVLMALASPAFVYLSDQLETETWQSYTSLWQIAPLALLYYGAANLFASGLIVLFGGFTNLPLRTSARARKGALIKLAGANLLIVCIAVVAVDDSSVVDESWEDSWFYIFALLLLVSLGRAGVVLVRKGWKYDAITAEKLLKDDTRPPGGLCQIV